MIVRRWWCPFHGTSATYCLRAGDPVPRCGAPASPAIGPALMCGFPVRPETRMDRFVDAVGPAAVDHLLYGAAVRGAQGGPRG